jgi:adenylate cyclase
VKVSEDPADMPGPPDSGVNGSSSGNPVEFVTNLLLGLGLPHDEIARAIEDRRLHLLVVDALLLPGEGRYTLGQVAQLSGMPLDQVRRFWRALGFPDAGEDECSFGESDVQALTILQGLLAHGMSDVEASVQMARVIGSSMARIAEAEITASTVLRGQADSAAMAEVFAMTASTTLPGLASLLEYCWRRHLKAAVRRAAFLMGSSDGGPTSVELAVGFADMVGFTVLSQQLSEAELADIVARFEVLAHDTVVSRGGRIVKMIGDEVMYVVEDVSVATDIALSLADAYADDEVLSDVRVGLAYGSVVARDGDYYGPVVNKASRVVNIAAPGSVLVTEEVHEMLSGSTDLEFRTLRPRYLKDLGRVHLWRVRHSAQSSSGRDRVGGAGGSQISPRRRRSGARLGVETSERLRSAAERWLPHELRGSLPGGGTAEE